MRKNILLKEVYATVRKEEIDLYLMSIRSNKILKNNGRVLLRFNTWTRKGDNTPDCLYISMVYEIIGEKTDICKIQSYIDEINVHRWQLINRLKQQCFNF